MSEPLNLAVGVRTALIMYASWISFRAEEEVLKWLRNCDRRAAEGVGFRAAIRKAVDGMMSMFKEEVECARFHMQRISHLGGVLGWCSSLAGSRLVVSWSRMHSVGSQIVR